MSYPGNPSLAQETKERLLATFSQTIDLAARGNREEALLGCDFILRMDPLFEPARKLLERLQEAGGAVDASDLQPAAEGEELSFASLEDFNAAASDFAVGEEAGGLKAQLELALRDRRPRDLLELAESEPEAVAADPDLRRLVEAAQSQLEAEPYVTRFLDQARLALESGQGDEVAKLIAKARALDAEHPGIAELERMRDGGAEPGELFDDLSLAGAPDLEMPAADEGDQRIDDLLAEGQAAFERGEHQAAIDAWSRIFLIDIDHAEAASRIEQARRLKAEAERKVEEVFHEAVAHFDAGERAQASAAFQRVIDMQPNHLAAREYLEQLEADPAGERPSPLAGPPAARKRLEAEILVPPDEAIAAAKRRPKPAPAPARPVPAPRPRRALLTIGSGVLVLLLAGGALVWLNRERLFPNSRAADLPPAGAAEPDALTRATELHGQGKTPAAIAQLRRLPPEDPQYDRAQALIQQWEAIGKPATPAGPAPEDLARRSALVEQARQAYAQREYLLADALFGQAAAIAPLDGTAADLAQDVRRQIAPLDEQIRLYKQGEWAAAVPSLWKIHHSEPQNRDVARLIVDSYYNLGVRELQRELPGDAAAHFKEALTLAPADPDLRRLAQFADAYSGRQQDLLYRTFVKYVPFRS